MTERLEQLPGQPPPRGELPLSRGAGPLDGPPFFGVEGGDPVLDLAAGDADPGFEEPCDERQTDRNRVAVSARSAT